MGDTGRPSDATRAWRVWTLDSADDRGEVNATVYVLGDGIPDTHADSAASSENPADPRPGSSPISMDRFERAVLAAGEGPFVLLIPSTEGEPPAVIEYSVDGVPSIGGLADREANWVRSEMGEGDLQDPLLREALDELACLEADSQT